MLDLVIAVLLPTAAFGSLVWGARLWRWVEHRRDMRRPIPVPQPARVHADVRRLRAALEDVENTPGLPAKHLRCEAARAAYVDALRLACTTSGVRPPSGRSVGRAEIYRVEADLRAAGLDVRPALPT